MAKRYMIGTLADKPLLMITVDGTKYLVDVDKKKVFLDTKGIPAVKDKETIKAVLEASK